MFEILVLHVDRVPKLSFSLVKAELMTNQRKCHVLINIMFALKYTYNPG